MSRKILFITTIVVVFGIGTWTFINLVQQNQPPESGVVVSESKPGIAQDTNGDQPPQTPSASPKPPANRTDSELLESIAKQRPELLDSNKQPSFAIVKSQRTPNAWYVVTIRNTRDATVSDAKLILKDNGDGAGLVVIAGPGTKFDSEVIALPEEVRKLL